MVTSTRDYLSICSPEVMTAMKVTWDVMHEEMVMTPGVPERKTVMHGEMVETAVGV